MIARHNRELSFIDPLAQDRARDAKGSLKIDKLLPPTFGDREILSRPNLVRGLKDRRSILSIRGRLIGSQNMGLVSVYRMLRILEILRLPPLLLPPPTPSSHPPLSPSLHPNLPLPPSALLSLPLLPRPPPSALSSSRYRRCTASFSRLLLPLYPPRACRAMRSRGECFDESTRRYF